jgi:hypothetical protein
MSQQSNLRPRVAKLKKYLQTRDAPEEGAEGAAYFNEDSLPTPPGPYRTLLQFSSCVSIR